MKKIFKIIAFLLLLIHSLSGEIWKFGLIADTQWNSDDGKNPNNVAAYIITQANAEFIRQGVKFVVAVGDLSNNSSAINALNTRATYVQNLYNAGIGFYPLRGNHDDYSSVATDFVKIFPQTSTGKNNDTLSYTFIVDDSSSLHPDRKKGSTFTIGKNFSSPSNATLKGLSYSFIYNNATFIFLDQFTLSDGKSISIKSQQSWIDSVLSHRSQGTHAFVFGHKGVITENHTDNLFGNNPGQDKDAENAFISSFVKNKVHYYIGGHDHLHNRSRVASPDGNSFIEEIILSSDSYKFYQPLSSPIGGSRETPISQDLLQIGYYIVTVDSLCTTIDYYQPLPHFPETGKSVKPLVIALMVKNLP
jgi:hypothetical protein